MKIAKTLALTAFAAMSFGVAGAMAQSEVPAEAGNGYWGARQVPVAQARIFTTHSPPAGSSDADPAPAALGHIPTFNFDYSVLANPG